MQMTLNFMIHLLLYFSVPISIRFIFLKKPIQKKWIAITILVALYLVLGSIVLYERNLLLKDIAIKYGAPISSSPHSRQFGSPILNLSIILSYFILTSRRSELSQKKNLQPLLIILSILMILGFFFVIYSATNSSPNHTQQQEDTQTLLWGPSNYSECVAKYVAPAKCKRASYLLNKSCRMEYDEGKNSRAWKDYYECLRDGLANTEQDKAAFFVWRACKEAHKELFEKKPVPRLSTKGGIKKRYRQDPNDQLAFIYDPDYIRDCKRKAEKALRVWPVAEKLRSSRSYERPTMGKDRTLYLPQLRWCTRESLRIETMRNIISGTSEFATTEQDYSSLCDDFDFFQEDLDRAKQEVNANKDQIINNAIQSARGILRTYSRRSPDD